MIEIGRALAGKMGHAGIGADAVRAVAAGAGSSREPLAFGDLLRHGVQRAKIVSPDATVEPLRVGNNPRSLRQQRA